MAYTHTYEVKFNGVTLEGELGIVSSNVHLKPSIPEEVDLERRITVEKIFKLLGHLNSHCDNCLIKFEVLIK